MPKYRVHYTATDYEDIVINAANPTAAREDAHEMIKEMSYGDYEITEVEEII